MINVASRATDGIRIANREATREDIIALFNKQLKNLKAHLNVRVMII